MIPVTTLSDKEEKPGEVYHNGTCTVCMQEITDRKYWRCPNSQCGRWEGGGRACDKCYTQMNNKRECPVCRGDIEKNLITDLQLLPSVLEYDRFGKHTILILTLCSLGKTHIDEVIAFAKRDADAMHALCTATIFYWYEFPLPVLQKLYSQLDSIILSRSSLRGRTDVRWDCILSAAESRVPWLAESAQWIFEWRRQHNCQLGVVSYRDSLLEADLLVACRTEHEFTALFQLATGVTKFDFGCFGDRITIYLSMKGQGEEWVLHRILATIPSDDGENNGKLSALIVRLFRKFPYDALYRWASSQNWTITKGIGFDVPKGIEYSLVPVFFACQTMGLYSHMKDRSVCVIDLEPNAARTFTLWAPDGSNKILYVDLRSDSVVRDWSKVENIKQVDAKGRDVCAEFRSDGVDIYFGSEIVVFAEKSASLRITGFGAFSAKRVASEKRKFHLIE